MLHESINNLTKFWWTCSWLVSCGTSLAKAEHIAVVTIMKLLFLTENNIVSSHGLVEVVVKVVFMCLY